MLKRHGKTTFIILLMLMVSFPSPAQVISLSEAIALARSSSVPAMEARQEFISAYWSWRSYKASLLPSLVLYGSFLNYNHSLTLLQSSSDGAMRYVSSFNLQNSLGLRISQNIPWTGGTVYVYSDLNRIDQFGVNKALTWYVQPITISFSQPLFAYNQFKWDRKIEPEEYEKKRRAYLEAMEQVTIDVTQAFYTLLLAQEEDAVTRSNLSDTRQLLAIAQERIKLGNISRDEYLQLELRMLEDSLALHESALKIQAAQMSLNAWMGKEETFHILTQKDVNLPIQQLDYDFVLDKALSNSRFNLDNNLDLLKAEAAVKKAKAEGGISMSFHARVGLSKSGVSLPAAYIDPLDQEVVGLSFSLPILDWGQAKGKVQKARAAQEVIKARVRQNKDIFRQRIFSSVSQFNRQWEHCLVSKKAMEIAVERYGLLLERFRSGDASVLELNAARSDNDSARMAYITDLGRYWYYYYTIRKETLFDFSDGKDIVVDEWEIMGHL